MMDKVSEILEKQLPRYFRPVMEFQEILKSHGYAVENIERNVKQIQDNFYLSTCDEDTVAYYEKLFGIACRLEDTLEFRRMRLQQKFNTIVPFSIGFLKDRLDELYGADGYQMQVDPVGCTLNIKVTSDRYSAVDLLYDLLWDVIPAHIQIIANQEITNRVPGRLYTGGCLTGSVLIQTICYQTVNKVAGEINTSGAVSGITVQTIQTGGESYGSL